jgi:putative flavoprotein involved in K+ transport
MFRTPVVVIGAGQAGLAVSHLLAAAGMEHVVLERGRVAERWASYSWESLRLLTPNWLSRLPGFRYAGPEPAGFMGAAEVADYLRTYAAQSRAPVVEGAEVLSVRQRGDGYEVVTAAGGWLASAVVVATGWCDVPYVPALAGALDPRIEQLTPASYRNPGALPDGGVLVVGASSTGVQLADELARTGRRVLLAVGSHTRIPRRYRGADSMWWVDAMGLLDRRLDEHPAPAAARAEPSLQLVGSATGRDVDLPALQDRGIGLAGRLRGAGGRRVRFAGDLAETTGRADARLRSLLRRIDAYAASAGLAGAADADPPGPIRGVRTDGAVRDLDLRRAGIRSVLWATGYRRSYPWLHVPVRGGMGEIQHVNGATPAPGLHIVGARWQSRRGSSFLDGVRHDAATVVTHLLNQINAGVHGRVA